MEKEWDVFVSYSRKDSAPVSHVVSDLRESGLSVWQDVSAVQPGFRIREAINEGIKGSKSFLVFLSKRSIRSPWVINNELDSAMREELSNRSNFVITVLLGNISIDEVPLDVQGKFFIDLRYNFKQKYLVQRTKLIQTLKLLSMAEQGEDYIVIEIGKEFMHFLIDYKYVGYNETFKIPEKALNILIENLIIGGMRKVWKESMSDTLKEFLTTFGSVMARRVATFALDSSGVTLTNKFNPFTDEDIYKITASTALLMLSLLTAEKLFEHDGGKVIKIKWIPGDGKMYFWMEESKSESSPR